MKYIINVSGKPYYYYGTYKNGDNVQRLKKKYRQMHPRIRSFVIKMYFKRDNKYGYALYFDRAIT